MKTVIGNWKMNVGTRESVALARGVLLALRGKRTLPEVVVCPSSVALSEVRKVVTRSHVGLGAQNMFWEAQGSYTGEISSRQLTELGVSHVILGHSERRQILGETDEMVHEKFLHALESGFTPIVCVGETKEERDRGEQTEVVERQIRAVFTKATWKNKQTVFVAYEPIWAIGTGVSATPEDAVLMHKEIRTVLSSLVPAAKKNHIKILYGGSVDGKNAYGFLREDEVDGVLVGGASVKISQFKEIMSAAIEVIEGHMQK